MMQRAGKRVLLSCARAVQAFGAALIGAEVGLLKHQVRPEVPGSNKSTQSVVKFRGRCGNRFFGV
jgi:hypothetical protein